MLSGQVNWIEAPMPSPDAHPTRPEKKRRAMQKFSSPRSIFTTIGPTILNFCQEAFADKSAFLQAGKLTPPAQQKTKPRGPEGNCLNMADSRWLLHRSIFFPPQRQLYGGTASVQIINDPDNEGPRALVKEAGWPAVPR